MVWSTSTACGTKTIQKSLLAVYYEWAQYIDFLRCGATSPHAVTGVKKVHTATDSTGCVEHANSISFMLESACFSDCLLQLLQLISPRNIID